MFIFVYLYQKLVDAWVHEIVKFAEFLFVTKESNFSTTLATLMDVVEL